MVENEKCHLGISQMFAQHVGNPFALIIGDPYFARGLVPLNVVFVISLLFGPQVIGKHIKCQCFKAARLLISMLCSSALCSSAVRLTPVVVDFSAPRKERVFFGVPCFIALHDIEHLLVLQ